MTRQCGTCQACCSIVPVGALKKPAATRCEHQRFKSGCAIYARRPFECALWSCAWLAAWPEAAALRRPDRAGYVVDVLPDSVMLNGRELLVAQVWTTPDDKRELPNDAGVQAFALEVAVRRRWGTLIRHGNERGTLLIAPPLSADGEWWAKEAALSPAGGLYGHLRPEKRLAIIGEPPRAPAEGAPS